MSMAAGDMFAHFENNSIRAALTIYYFRDETTKLVIW